MKRKIYRIEILRSFDEDDFEVYLNGNRADEQDEKYILRHFQVRANDILRHNS